MALVGYKWMLCPVTSAAASAAFADFSVRMFALGPLKTVSAQKAAMPARCVDIRL
jgi:hypothetical protein